MNNTNTTNLFMSIDSSHENYIQLDFLRITKDKVVFEGLYVPSDFMNKDSTLVISINGVLLNDNQISIINNTTPDNSGEIKGSRFNFYLLTSQLSKNNSIKFVIDNKEKVVENTKLIFNNYFPLSNIFTKLYFYKNGLLFQRQENQTIFVSRTSPVSAAIREILLFKELISNRFEGSKKAILARMAHRVFSLLKRKKIWLISDRYTSGDDNGEALLKYLNSNRIKNIILYYVLDKNSRDYSRISRYGKTVEPMSFKHKLLYLLSDYNISSHADADMVNPLSGHQEPYKDLIYDKKFVFLQHGVIKDDLSRWLNKYNKNIFGFITSSKKEYDSIVHGNYAYDTKNIWLTGLPRFDTLQDKKEKIITIMPTWRRYLLEEPDRELGQWSPKKIFYTSNYFRFYKDLLINKKLNEEANKYGYKILFFPHNTVNNIFKDGLHDIGSVHFVTNTSYQEIYSKSSLIITDYSSAVFDFAYLRKPVIYCQFDKDQFFSGNHIYDKGYFDYEKDGFGEVEYSLDTTVDRIIEYMKNECEIKPKYLKRIDNFFEFRDRNSCKRVCDCLLKHQND